MKVNEMSTLATSLIAAASLALVAVGTTSSASLVRVKIHENL